MTLSCDACGHTEELRANCLSVASSAGSGLEPGWAHLVNEDYCPICAEVRSTTWGYASGVTPSRSQQ